MEHSLNRQDSGRENVDNPLPLLKPGKMQENAIKYYQITKLVYRKDRRIATVHTDNSFDSVCTKFVEEAAALQHAQRRALRRLFGRDISVRSFCVQIPRALFAIVK